MLLLVGVSRVAFAQARPEIDIRVAPTAYPPVVAVRGVLTEQPFDELLRTGFPARLQVRAELWTIARWFDDVLETITQGQSSTLALKGSTEESQFKAGH